MTQATITPISVPALPLAGEAPDTLVETMVLPKVDNSITPFVTKYSFQLYGGKENGNDELVDEWKSAQEVSAENIELNFSSANEYDVDGYVLQGLVDINQDTDTGGYIYLCIQAGNDPGLLCA